MEYINKATNELVFTKEPDHVEEEEQLTEEISDIENAEAEINAEDETVETETVLDEVSDEETVTFETGNDIAA